MVHFDAYAVVVVDARQCLEDIDMHSGKIRIYSLIDSTVPLHHILGAGMANPHGTPALNDAHGGDGNTGFGGMHDYVLDRLAAPENAASKRMIFNDAGPHQ